MNNNLKLLIAEKVLLEIGKNAGTQLMSSFLEARLRYKKNSRSLIYKEVREKLENITGS